MDWKTKALRTLAWKVLLLGGIAGLWAGLLEELTRLLLPASPPPLLAALPVVALGLGLGVFLAPIESLLHRFPHRVLRAALVGGALSGSAAVLGQGALRLLQSMTPVQGAHWLPWVGIPLQLGLFGAAAGVASSAGGAHWNLARRRALHGLWAGAVLGGIFAGLLDRAAAVEGIYGLGLVGWAALFAWLLYWREVRFAKRWLRVVTGPGEDGLFALLSEKISLGRLEINDIPLPHHREVFPQHCLLTREQSHYRIVDEEQGGLVLVNFRQIQEQTLKSGDLLKVGSALLQYGEGK